MAQTRYLNSLNEILKLLTEEQRKSFEEDINNLASACRQAISPKTQQTISYKANQNFIDYLYNELENERKYTKEEIINKLINEKQAPTPKGAQIYKTAKKIQNIRYFLSLNINETEALKNILKNIEKPNKETRFLKTKIENQLKDQNNDILNIYGEIN